MKKTTLILIAVFLTAVGILALSPLVYETYGDVRAIEQEAGMTIHEALAMCDEGIYAHDWYADHPKACIDPITGNTTHNREWQSKYERLKKLVKLLSKEVARN